MVKTLILSGCSLRHLILSWAYTEALINLQLTHSFYI